MLSSPPPIEPHSDKTSALSTFVSGDSEGLAAFPHQVWALNTFFSVQGRSGTIKYYIMIHVQTTEWCKVVNVHLSQCFYVNIRS